MRWLAVGALGIVAVSVVIMPPSQTGSAAVGDPVVAAGDIACANGVATGSCEHDSTARLIGRIAPTRVLPLGDLHYGPTRTAAEFTASYGPFASPATRPSWGDYKAITSPTIGSHEYDGYSTADGYFAYWNGSATSGGRAGAPSQGYYAETIGAWKVLHANSQKGSTSSAQLDWLKAELATAPRCALVLWHHPRFSSGTHGNQSRAIELFKVAHAGGADVLLSANDHLYERFAPQNPTADADTAKGVTQFVVGTGGRSLYKWGTVKPNSAFRNNTSYGVLKLTLKATGYDWAFVTIADKVLDSGSATCR